MSKRNIKIEKINYFGESTNSNDYNAKCLYYKHDKLYLVHLWVDFFNQRVHISKNQPKECKALSGLSEAVNAFAAIEYKFKKSE